MLHIYFTKGGIFIYEHNVSRISILDDYIKNAISVSTDLTLHINGIWAKMAILCVSTANLASKYHTDDIKDLHIWAQKGEGLTGTEISIYGHISARTI